MELKEDVVIKTENIDHDYWSSSVTPGESQTEQSDETRPDNSSCKDDDDEYIIRCICGFKFDDGFLVRCELCWVWQHLICMMTRGTDKNIPEVYLCERCQPRPVNAARARDLQAQNLSRSQKIDRTASNKEHQTEMEPNNQVDLSDSPGRNEKRRSSSSTVESAEAKSPNLYPEQPVQSGSPAGEPDGSDTDSVTSDSIVQQSAKTQQPVQSGSPAGEPDGSDTDSVTSDSIVQQSAKTQQPVQSGSPAGEPDGSDTDSVTSDSIVQQSAKTQQPVQSGSPAGETEGCDTDSVTSDSIVLQSAKTQQQVQSGSPAGETECSDTDSVTSDSIVLQSAKTQQQVQSGSPGGDTERSDTNSVTSDSIVPQSAKTQAPGTSNSVLFDFKKPLGGIGFSLSRLLAGRRKQTASEICPPNANSHSKKKGESSKECAPLPAKIEPSAVNEKSSSPYEETTPNNSSVKQSKVKTSSTVIDLSCSETLDDNGVSNQNRSNLSRADLKQSDRNLSDNSPISNPSKCSGSFLSKMLVLRQKKTIISEINSSETLSENSTTVSSKPVQSDNKTSTSNTNRLLFKNKKPQKKPNTTSHAVSRNVRNNSEQAGDNKPTIDTTRLSNNNSNPVSRLLSGILVINMGKYPPPVFPVSVDTKRVGKDKVHVATVQKTVRVLTNVLLDNFRNPTLNHRFSLDRLTYQKTDLPNQIKPNFNLKSSRKSIQSIPEPTDIDISSILSKIKFNPAPLKPSGLAIKISTDLESSSQTGKCPLPSVSRFFYEYPSQMRARRKLSKKIGKERRNNLLSGLLKTPLVRDFLKTVPKRQRDVCRLQHNSESPRILVAMLAKSAKREQAKKSSSNRNSKEIIKITQGSKKNHASQGSAKKQRSVPTVPGNNKPKNSALHVTSQKQSSFVTVQSKTNSKKCAPRGISRQPCSVTSSVHKKRRQNPVVLLKRYTGPPRYKISRGNSERLGIFDALSRRQLLNTDTPVASTPPKQDLFGSLSSIKCSTGTHQTSNKNKIALKTSQILVKSLLRTIKTSQKTQGDAAHKKNGCDKRESSTHSSKPQVANVSVDTGKCEITCDAYPGGKLSKKQTGDDALFPMWCPNEIKLTPFEKTVNEAVPLTLPSCLFEPSNDNILLPSCLIETSTENIALGLPNSSVETSNEGISLALSNTSVETSNQGISLALPNSSVETSNEGISLALPNSSVETSNQGMSLALPNSSVETSNQGISLALPNSSVETSNQGISLALPNSSVETSNEGISLALSNSSIETSNQGISLALPNSSVETSNQGISLALPNSSVETSNQGVFLALPNSSVETSNQGISLALPNSSVETSNQGISLALPNSSDETSNEHPVLTEKIKECDGNDKGALAPNSVGETSLVEIEENQSSKNTHCSLSGQYEIDMPDELIASYGICSENTLKRKETKDDPLLTLLDRKRFKCAPPRASSKRPVSGQDALARSNNAATNTSQVSNMRDLIKSRAWKKSSENDVVHFTLSKS